MLSENTIKQATLRFLKAYYKYREREGETIARYDMTTQSGIIADGHLSFPQEDGSYFLATFEASSYQSRKEVIFRKQHKTLIWDSLALASVVAAIVYGYGYLYDHFTVKQLGALQSFGVLAGVFLTAFVLFVLIFHQISRYRYIYAIEQFKKYHADEQWIAIGSDVFKVTDDQALRELKKQCVYGGFGLISVSMDETAQLLITPSREQVLRKKRKRMLFTEQGDQKLSPTRKRMKNIGQKMLAPFSKLYTKLFKKNIPSGNLLLRYRRPVYRQVLLFGFSLSLISLMFYREIREASMNYVNERSYTKKMEAFGKKTQAEVKQALKDSTNLVAAEERGGYYEEVYYREQKQKMASQNSSTGSPKPQFREGDLLEMQAEPSQDVQIYLSVDGKMTNYDCSRFHHFRQTLYLVEDAIFSNAAAALDRVALLRDHDLKANLLWLGCFSDLERSYVVYIDQLHEVSAEAQVLATQHDKRLRAKGLPQHQVNVRSLAPLAD